MQKMSIKDIVKKIICIERFNDELEYYDDNFITELSNLSDEDVIKVAFELSLVNIDFLKIAKRQINAYGVSDFTEINIDGRILNYSYGYSEDDKVLDLLVIAHCYIKKEKLLKEYEALKKALGEPFSYRIVVINNLDDYNKFIKGIKVRDIVFTDISKVSQEMYEVLRTRLVR